MNIQIELSPLKLARLLFTVIAVFMILSVIANGVLPLALNIHSDVIYKATQFFSVDAERSLPTWYSSLALVGCAILIAIIAQHKAKIADPYKWHWRGLTALFLLLALDEALALHEETIEPLRAIFGGDNFMFYPWVILGAIFVLTVGVFYLRFLLHLPAKYRRLFLIAGGMFVTGALGFELIGGFVAANPAYNPPYLYPIFFHMEELLEMTSVVVLIYTLTSYIQEYMPKLQVKIGSVESIATAPVSAAHK